MTEAAQSPSARPRASVILPTIGSARLNIVVERLLASDASMEVVIVVDDPELDGSTLPQAPQVRVLRNAQNMGIAHSLNVAIAAARGEIIIRNDDDDMPSIDRVAKILSFFDENPSCDLVYSHAWGRDEISGGEWLISGPTDDESIKARLMKRNFIVHSSLAFRKSRLAAIEFYDATFRYAQDYDLYLRAIRAGFVFGGIAEPLIERQYHSQSVTVSRRRQQILFSFAARLLFEAQRGAEPWKTIGAYGLLLLIPDWMRSLRRRLSFGR